MTSTYTLNEAPGIDQLAIGVIAAAENDGRWYRAIVESINKENCTVKLLDHGGRLTGKIGNFRVIIYEFNFFFFIYS